MIRVLFVDDEPEQLDSLRDNFTNNGFDVATATKTQEALSCLIDFRPHVVVIDFKLEGETGFEILKTIREMDKFIPVVLYSAQADEDDKENLIGADIDFILEKGSKPSALRRLVDRLYMKKDDFVASFEKWAETSAAGDEPLFLSSDGNTLSAKQALIEMKKGSIAGHHLLEQYKMGLSEVWSVRQTEKDLEEEEI